MHKLSKSQKKNLLKNPNVERLTDSFVVFSAKFKVMAVEAFLNGQDPDQIFLALKVPINFFKPDYPRLCIKRWRKKYEQSGPEALSLDLRKSGKSGRPRKENLDDSTYEELQAIIEIQRGVIEELKKKKALAKKKY